MERPLPRFLRGTVFALALLASAGCQVLPPPHAADAVPGVVRAGSPAEARRVAQMLERLAPAVVARVPGSRARDLEVWVQESPAIYRFALSAYADADGFYADEPRRIHLRSAADDVERTLAHELVHASLGRAWRALPGTIEEGLCDAVSAELVPGGAARMRAGRISSACFATGGLTLDLDVWLPESRGVRGGRLSFHARMKLEGDPPREIDPLDVFEVEAGLSSSRVDGDAKKAFYGLAYLIVDRAIERVGLEGLHELCSTAHAERREVSPCELLAAAELGRDEASWRQALLDALGPDELAELVRMHPEFLAGAIADFLMPHRGASTPAELLRSLEARLSVAGGRGEVDLLGVPELRGRLAAALPSEAEAPFVAGR